MSNEKKTWLFKVFFGDEILPSFIGDSIISHEIRIPINQPVFQWKVRPFFFRGSDLLVAGFFRKFGRSMPEASRWK